ncbi:MAG: type II toxin-antitoxin system RelE/ParE family toxin [Phycisphaerales bacterium]
MSGYVITPAADADLEEIWQYVALNSGEARADFVEDELHAAMQRLAEMPGIGHLRIDLADEALRFFSVQRFLIVYRPEFRPVQIIRVLHGARDVQAILE